MPSTLAQQRIVDPVLTTLAQGYHQPELIAHKLLPIIPHDKEGGKVPKYGKEAFMAYNTTRAPRTAVVRLDYENSSIDFVMEEEAAEVPVDERESTEAALEPEKIATFLAQGVINLTHERKVASQVTATSSYGSGNYVNVASDDRWSNYASATSLPILAIDNAKEAVRTAVGIYPNTLVLGPAVFKALKNHPTVLERIKYSQTGVITEELLASLLNVPTVLVGTAVTASDAGVMSDIWGKDAVLAYVPAAEKHLLCPAFGYTLRKRGRPTAEWYYDNRAKSKVISVSDIFAAKLMSPDAGYLFKGAVA